MTKLVVLPNLVWKPSPNFSSRSGHPVELVVVHRWGEPEAPYPEEAKTYGGVVNYFSNPASKVSAHVVFPGSADPGQATQMVQWASMAWAEAAYNPVSDDVESSDDIWIGNDTYGMEVLARIVAFRLTMRGLPCVWSTRKGFCRHADLGAAGGGHTACPTTDLTQWRKFVSMVEHEFQRGGFRRNWGW
jgi:hypothetical protein